MPSCSKFRARLQSAHPTPNTTLQSKGRPYPAFTFYLYHVTNSSLHDTIPSRVLAVLLKQLSSTDSPCTRHQLLSKQCRTCRSRILVKDFSKIKGHQTKDHLYSHLAEYKTSTPEPAALTRECYIANRMGRCRSRRKSHDHAQQRPRRR